MQPATVKSLRQLSAALVLTLGIFAIPVMPRIPYAPPPMAVSGPPDRAVTIYLPPAPEPEPEPEPEPGPAPPPVAKPAAQAPTQVVSTAAAPPPAEAPPVVEAPVEVPPPAPRPKVAKARKPRPKRECKPDVPEISSRGPDEWEVARDLIDHYANHLNEAARIAHVTWAHDEEGDIIGFRVVKVRCGSPLHEAGFQDGDIITRINGHKVRTVPQALAAYVELRVRRKLRVRGTRKDGSPLDNRYFLT